MAKGNFDPKAIATEMKMFEDINTRINMIMAMQERLNAFIQHAAADINSLQMRLNFVLDEMLKEDPTIEERFKVYAEEFTEAQRKEFEAMQKSRVVEEKSNLVI